MKYNNQDISSLTINELQAADWELAAKEAKWDEAMKHSKFNNSNGLKTISPKPQLGEAFVKLRNEIKKAIEAKNGNG